MRETRIRKGSLPSSHSSVMGRRLRALSRGAFGFGKRLMMPRVCWEATQCILRIVLT